MTWTMAELGKVKKALLGTFHAIREKHVPCYPADIENCFNRCLYFIGITQPLIFAPSATQPRLITS